MTTRTPPRRRPRITDLLIDQMRATAEWLEQLTAAELQRPSAVPGWSVRHLVGHLMNLQHELAAGVTHPTSQRPAQIDQHVRHRRSMNSQAHERATATCGEDDTLLVQQVHAGTTEFACIIDQIEAPVVMAQPDPLRLKDLLRLQLTSWVLMAEDLRASLPDRGAVPVDRAAQAEAVRFVADLLTKELPGRSVEVRVPPFAAVQVGLPLSLGASTPAHTRGTPANVVETDPATFLRLANGRSSWQQAVTDRRLQASGAHSDLSSVWPLLR